MSLSIGIVGLPNVGKSTLFNALTKKNVLAANYPFATIEPAVGTVAVPDERLDKLAQVANSQRKLPAIVEFVDIAGLVKGASEGEGLGNKFLHNIRETSAIAQMVRIFEDDDIHHVHNQIDPLDDIAIINWELTAADLQTLEKHRDKLAKDLKRGDKEAKQLSDLLDMLEEHLTAGNLIWSLRLDADQKRMIKHLHFLTDKPFLYILNKQTGGKNLDEMDDERYRRLLEYLDESDSLFVKLDAATEGEISEMTPEERADFRAELNIDNNEGIDALIKKGYDLLGLITYFTVGETEARGWTVRTSSSAAEAAGVIHTDFQKNFIRAEVIEWHKFIEAGSRAVARDRGWLRTEGKDYIVQDGDVIEFKT